jgi:hypothetical protein
VRHNLQDLFYNAGSLLVSSATAAVAYDVFAFALAAVGGPATQLTFSLEYD